MSSSTRIDSDFVGSDRYLIVCNEKYSVWLEKVNDLFIMVDIYYMCQVITVRNDLLVSSN